MALPEHIFQHQERYAPDNPSYRDSSESTEVEHLHPGFESKPLLSDSPESYITDRNEAMGEVWTASASILLLAGNTPDQPAGSQKLDNEDEDSNTAQDSEATEQNNYFRVLHLGLNPDEDLSCDAQWLLNLMLLDEDNVETLRQEAQAIGINFRAAYEELDGYGLVVTGQSGRIQLPYQLIRKR